MAIALIPASEDKINWIRQMATEIWNEHYVDIIGQEQVNYMLGKFYSEEFLLSQWDKEQHFFIIKLDEKEIGYLSITWKSESEIFLNKFYIFGNFRGKNIGSQVFDLLLAENATIELIKLQVNRKNFKSINFYFKKGFEISYVADFDVGEGFYMNDFIMEWKKKM